MPTFAAYFASSTESSVQFAPTCAMSLQRPFAAFTAASITCLRSSTDISHHSPVLPVR